MASEQREKERIERKEKKNKKKRLIAWIVIGAIAAVLLVMRIAEIDFSSIADGSAFSSSQESSFPYELNSGSDLYFGSVGSSLCILEDSTYTVLDHSDAKEKISFDHGLSNPIIRTAGGYSLLYDQGGVSYRLDNSSGNVYRTKAEDQILCADVSDSGTVAVCTTSDEHTSEILVYNKSMSLKFSYGTSAGYITSVAVDSRGTAAQYFSPSPISALVRSIQTLLQCVLRRHIYADAGGAGLWGCFSPKALHLNKANGPWNLCFQGLWLCSVRITIGMEEDPPTPWKRRLL